MFVVVIYVGDFKPDFFIVKIIGVGFDRVVEDNMQFVNDIDHYKSKNDVTIKIKLHKSNLFAPSVRNSIQNQEHGN